MCTLLNTRSLLRRVRVLVLMPAIAMCAVLLAQPVVAIAEAGWEETSRCCCPDVRDCHCPKGDAADHDAMRRCGNSGELVAPALTRIIVATVDVATPTRDPVELPMNEPTPLHTQWEGVPECPPF